MSYRIARYDFEKLEQLAELSDQVELDSERLHLMQNPTQKTAADMYESGIRLWFREHGVDHRTVQIAFRHNILTRKSDRP